MPTEVVGPARYETTLSVETGFKFGVGFALGAMFITVVGWILVFGMLGLTLSALVSPGR